MENTAYKSTASKMWYYVEGGKKCGPVSEPQLKAMLESGQLPATTRVWSSGMPNWLSANDTSLANGTPASRPAVVTPLNTAEQPAPRKSRWWIWLIVGLAVVGLAVACIFLFSSGLGSDGEKTAAVDYKLKETVVFENEECSFIIDTVGEKGDYLELDVRCINKTSDVLVFTWDSTCISGSMFDPMWDVTVLGNSTMKSSITFPLSTLERYNLLPADQIKFVLQVLNRQQYSQIVSESGRYIVSVNDILDETLYADYKQIAGYEDYLFHQDVQTDATGRPYYISVNETTVYFDEIYGLNGQQLYATASNNYEYTGFYDDPFGRPYYFSENGETVYYDGYGFAFYDEASGKNYFFDENGKAAYYGNDGLAEYYEGEVSDALLEKGKPEALAKTLGSYVVHKEFVISPTGKNTAKVTFPERITASSEQVYWNGEKGKFIVLGGVMDEFKGYILHTYVENNSDGYMYFRCYDMVVNGVDANSDAAILRPNSSCYMNIVIPAELLKTNRIKEVEQIDFRVGAAGENLSVPLYPIEWTAVALELKK